MRSDRSPFGMPKLEDVLRANDLGDAMETLLDPKAKGLPCVDALRATHKQMRGNDER